MASVVPSFRVGSKELYLPMASIIFHRTTDPHAAKFQVPLWFSKLDLRDYLWHAYGVETYSARSYVKLSPVRPKEGHQIRRWHRPRSRKFITVELARPFVWPEEPEDLSEWNAESVMGAAKDQKAFQESLGSRGDTIINEERRERMKEQARELLEGRREWKAPAHRFGTEVYSKGR